jgi:ABC-type transport system involved in multi-copper enzyme maturation permease subunit
MIRIFYASLLISLALSAMALYGGETEHANLLEYVAAVVITFQVGLVALVSPSLTSSTVSTELENGTWEVLRLTPLSGWRIFWGKFIPAFLPALLPVIALLPAYGALWYIQRAYLQFFLLVIPVVVLASAFCCTLGLLCSTLFANTARATVMAYLAAAAVFVLPMIAWFASGVVLSEKVAAHIGFVSPLVVAVNVLPEGWAAIDQYGLYHRHLYLIGGLTLLMLIAAWLRLATLMRKG